jgi:hypothetical protein
MEQTEPMALSAQLVLQVLKELRELPDQRALQAQPVQPVPRGLKE